MPLKYILWMGFGASWQQGRFYFTAVRPKLLPILVNIGTTSQEANKVPSGKGPLLFISSILLDRSEVSFIKEGNLGASGCK